MLCSRSSLFLRFLFFYFFVVVAVLSSAFSVFKWSERALKGRVHIYSVRVFVLCQSVRSNNDETHHYTVAFPTKSFEEGYTSGSQLCVATLDGHSREVAIVLETLGGKQFRGLLGIVKNWLGPFREEEHLSLNRL